MGILRQDQQRNLLSTSSVKLGLRAVIYSVTVAAFALVLQISAGHAQEVSGERLLDREEQSNVNVFKQSSPSVVNISTRKAIAAQGRNVTLNMGRIQSGTGSGFLWDSNGHVVTNYHVVEDSSVVRVRLTDGTEWNANILGKAPEFDLAVLKIDAPKERLRPLALGRLRHRESVWPRSDIDNRNRQRAWPRN